MKALITLFLAATLYAPAAFGANPARPGTLNYVEGSASIGDQALTAKSVGTVELDPGQVLSTENGKAELLLTPGVFLRLDSNSAVKMITPDLTKTQLELERGRATVEVADIHKQNDIEITEGGTTTRIEKTGLYEFDASDNSVRVYKGQAEAQVNDKDVKIKGKHELDIATADPTKTHKFDTKKSEDQFYNWTSLRSSYLAQANAEEAANYAGVRGFGTGWYWDPYFSAYTFIPGDGYLFSPFGWGFYSPWMAFDAPIGYYGVPYGWYGRRGYAGRGVVVRGARPVGPHVTTPIRGPIHLGGMSGGMHSGIAVGHPGRR